ncbi:hypothetical protein [Bacillus sp. FJAT-27264]|nr:hypothetical protein [Bacillus sp. FJAT-27264]
MSSTSGGLFLLNGLSVVGVLLWLASLGMATDCEVEAVQQAP